LKLHSSEQTYLDDGQNCGQNRSLGAPAPQTLWR
jgi:hypothetical protein